MNITKSQAITGVVAACSAVVGAGFASPAVAAVAPQTATVDVVADQGPSGAAALSLEAAEVRVMEDRAFDNICVLL